MGIDRKNTFMIATRGNVGDRSPGRSVWMPPQGLVPELSPEG